MAPLHFSWFFGFHPYPTISSRVKTAFIDEGQVTREDLLVFSITQRACFPHTLNSEFNIPRLLSLSGRLSWGMSVSSIKDDGYLGADSLGAFNFELTSV